MKDESAAAACEMIEHLPFTTDQGIGARARIGLVVMRCRIRRAHSDPLHQKRDFAFGQLTAGRHLLKMHRILSILEKSLQIHRVDGFQGIKADFALLLVRAVARNAVTIHHL